VKRILILPNPLKRKAVEFTAKLVELLLIRGFEPVLEPEIAGTLKLPEPQKSVFHDWNGIDLIMVLGGDGSMLNAARRVYPHQIPLLGINMGQLGFLTRIETPQVESALDDLKNGVYYFEERAMLAAEVFRDAALVGKLTGLNELVVAKGASARMIRLETWIDDKYFTTYPADGLIIATATGSTAYSLSAGGPILDPRLTAILISPICAHSLYSRPVVLHEAAQIKIILNANHTDINLTADGQIGINLQPGDQIHLQRAPYNTKLIYFENQGVFDVLKSHLGEGRI
jgi:NAD+ kinase